VAGPPRSARVAGRVEDELARTVHEPRRALNLFKPSRLRSLIHSFRGGAGGWLRDGAFRRRQYGSYDGYLNHQSSKPLSSDLRTHDAMLRATVSERLKRDGLISPGMRTLCLGARLGGEVRAFLDSGCFAVGIDVNPRGANRYVLQGDFHELQFPRGCVDVVYTNSLDHAFDIDGLLLEVRRVLRPGGFLIVDAVKGLSEGHPPGFYEAFYWGTIDDLVALITSDSFVLQVRDEINDPWPGEHLVFIHEPGKIRLP